MGVGDRGDEGKNRLVNEGEEGVVGSLSCSVCR